MEFFGRMERFNILNCGFTDDICLQCIVIEHNLDSTRFKTFVEIRSWLYNNIGNAYQLAKIPRCKGDNLKGKWSIETYTNCRVYWIENDEKRLEFALIWS